jgi:cytoskeleton protein RodZ
MISIVAEALRYDKVWLWYSRYSSRGFYFLYFPPSHMSTCGGRFGADRQDAVSRRKDLLDEVDLAPEQAQAEPPPATEPEQRPSRRHGVGQLLREARESQGSDINRVSAALRIRAAYLEAIEEGRYGSLPGAVYALGFVRTYATHLGLDGEEAVRRFKLEAEGFSGQRDLTFPVPLGERSIPGGPLVLTAVILAICGYGLFYYLTSNTRLRVERVSPVPPELALPRLPSAPPAPAPASTSEEPRAASMGSSLAQTSTAPADASTPGPVDRATTPASDRPTPTATATPAPTPTPATPEPPMLSPPAAPAAAALPSAPAATTSTAELPPAAATEASPAAPPPDKSHVYGLADGNARIVIRAVTTTWIQVHDKDGASIFTRQLHPGDIYYVPDQPGLTLRTGAASGLAFTVDGRAAPSLSGNVRNNVPLDPDRLLAGTATGKPPRPPKAATVPALAPDQPE